MTINTPEESISNDYISHTSKVMPPYEQLQQPASTITSSSPARPITPGPAKAPRSSPPVSPPLSSSPKPTPAHPPVKEENREPAKPQKNDETIKREEKEKPKKMCPRCGKGEWYGLCAICGYPGRTDLM